MKFSNPLTKDGLAEEMDRICKSNTTSYPLKDKAARVNAALDRYFSLAFEADRRWNFDDINETSPPIDTQNLVSGTNRYKLSAFTETLLSVIRIEALDSSGTGIPLTPEVLGNLDKVTHPGNTSGSLNYIGTSTFQELYVNADAGTPTHYIKYGDFIYLRPNPNYSYTDGLLAYFNRPASKFDFTTVAISNASPAVCTATAHGLAIGDTVILQTDGTLPTGLTVDTTYYLVATVAANTFSLAATLGGTAINTSSAGTGIHYFLETSKVPGVPVIHHPWIAKYASLPYLIENDKKQTRATAQEITIGEESIQQYFAYRDKDTRKGMTPHIEDTR